MRTADMPRIGGRGSPACASAPAACSATRNARYRMGMPPLYHLRVSELKQLGRYEIKGVLGKGAMGLVYDGLDPQLNRRVAIKTIITKGLDEATAKHYAMRFRKEVRAVAKLSH